MVPAVKYAQFTVKMEHVGHMLTFLDVIRLWPSTSVSSFSFLSPPFFSLPLHISLLQATKHIQLPPLELPSSLRARKIENPLQEAYTHKNQRFNFMNVFFIFYFLFSFFPYLFIFYFWGNLNVVQLNKDKMSKEKTYQRLKRSTIHYTNGETYGL